jgi:phosphate transport system permease protein
MKEAQHKRTRRMETRWSVRAADKIAKFTITVGGIGTIMAVSAVFVFLVVVVVPLFLPGWAEEEGTVRVENSGSRLIHLGVDEYRVMSWSLFADGTVRVIRLDTGELLDTLHLVDGDSVSAWSVESGGGSVAFGYLDGSVRLGEISFATDFLPDSLLSADVASLEVGEITALDDAVVERTPEGQLRRQRLEVSLSPPMAGMGTSEIVLLDHIGNRDGSVVCLLTADGQLRVNRVETYENLMTGEVEFDVTGGARATPYRRDAGDMPDFVVVTESVNNVYLVWSTGRIERFDTRDIEAPVPAGSGDLMRGGGEITAFEMLLGGETFLVGDSEGAVRAWFRYVDPGRPDDFKMACAHTFAGYGAGVTALSTSPRSRVFAAGYADGRVVMFQVTSEARILDLKVDADKAVTELVVGPKGDGIIALADSELYHYTIDEMHPEATLASMFRPVWYEGYSGPEHVWQSSSGTDDFEPKFGLWPLVFGTLKATIYSMLFGIPLALLAAIFTSEFLTPQVRPRVKTLIESMASLPSVVLGFLAALVFAPFVQRVVPSAMVGFVTLPAMLLVGAYVWQALPMETVLRLERFRLLFFLATLPVGVWLASVLGPWVEDLLFEGDVIMWLDGQRGSGVGGWIMLLLPVSAVVVILLMGRFVGPRFRAYAARSPRGRVAAADAGRFAAGTILTIIVAGVGAWLLTTMGLDPRGSNSLIDTYVQRNALIVGFVMGFAIIPIIYTIAEDALSAVPEHLRAASLGAGATPWQTAIRIVLPTAMSGLFSAIMIGLGRAVGETMIVLMAAGNTPVLEMNIFNGFRTLSANIAVELPEAVRDSTHYRTLFLAALILFLMTFTINTLAELVRLRFRKRSAQI